MDHEKRKAAANLLQGLLDGKITNDDYDNDFPERPDDAGLTVVYDRIWLYYSGLHTHFLESSKLSPDDVALFHRCILFLETDIEYSGPLLRRSLISRFKDLFRRGGQRLGTNGDQTTRDEILGSASWPFNSQFQLDDALRDRSGVPFP